MNRLAVLLAAMGTLGTGCVVSDSCNVPSRTVSVGWPSFLFFDGTYAVGGTQAARCASANVDWIDLYMDDQRVANPAGGTNGYWLCADGGVNVTGVPNDGSHLFTVEGIDIASSAIAYRDEVSVSPGCDVLVNTQPSEGTFTLAYSFTPVNECTTGSYIWFRMTDNISKDVIAVDENNNPTTYACSSLISFRLASGSYTVDRTEEVITPAAWTATATDCSQDTFNLAGAQNLSVPRPMTDSTSLCP